MQVVIEKIKAIILTVSIMTVFTDFSFSSRLFPGPSQDFTKTAKGPQTAVFAGGCFWGVQGVFERLKGVTSTTAGYAGGNVANPSYETVSGGATGHAESVKIIYNPEQISYGSLLKVFFSIAHNPTELNYQGPDFGTQYRSIIFYTTPGQKKTAEEYIDVLNKAGVYSKPIVTALQPLIVFYDAEDYHQHFMDKNPDYPYIVMWDRPKIQALNKAYPDLIK